MPLVEVLDEEVGIGFGAVQEPGGEPLLQGLDLPPPIPEPGTWQARDDYLLRRLTEALERGEQEIALNPRDLDALALVEPLPPLPDALGAFARLASSSAEAVDRGDFRLWIQSASGPSGARLLGRFCHGDMPTIADIGVVTQVTPAKTFGVDLAPYKRVVRVYDSCMAVPAFADAHPAKQPDAE